ncbi:MAG: class I SAM-dependent methyltransferase, partial [Pseudomonadales bacterium]|nr:class I SAM-dependent methyltransferase [Pseudomonadales bacterium]
MPRFEPFDWYEQPLYYDMIFDESTDAEATFLRAARERYGAGKGCKVLEPACGTGRLMAALVRKGWTARGVDCEPGMVEFARQRLKRFGLRARVALGRMEAFETRERFDLAHCLVSSFKHLPTEAQAVGHLRCVAAALKPGGVYVLGLHLTEYEETKRSRERWTASDGKRNVVCNIQSWPPDRRMRTEWVRARMTVEE